MEKESKKKQSILLIEDEKILSDLLTKKLEGAGYRVEVVSDGEEGLSKIRALKPDLVLLDMLLPKLSGFSILETLYREKRIPALPVIVISNSGQPVEIDRVQKLGIRDYLVKLNFDPDEVLIKVNSVLKAEKNVISLSSDAESRDLKKDGDSSAPAILVVEDDLLLAGLL